MGTCFRVEYSQLPSPVNKIKLVTCSAANTLESCREVERFPDSHLRDMKIILTNVSRCLLRNKILQLDTIVVDFSCYLCTHTYVCEIAVRTSIFSVFHVQKMGTGIPLDFC